MMGKIVEIFKSIQGEGPYQGETHIFVRLYGCNLACAYCDTDTSTFQEMTCEDVLNHITALAPCRTVSITGGEPLMQVDFLIDLVQKLKSQEYKILLETNGVLFEELGKIIDVVSMDFKLPSATHGGELWYEHGEFLKIARKKEVYVKAIVAPQTQIGDILETIKTLREYRDVLLVLQPQHPYEKALMVKLAFYKMLCKLHGLNVIIMEQLHRKLGLR
jgi:7-carboxy-7-deazaguanine synthase